VTNMPAAVSYASTISLTNVTLPYALELANLGFVKAVKTDAFLGKGVNVYAGDVTNQGVASAHGLEYKLLEELI